MQSDSREDGIRIVGTPRTDRSAIETFLYLQKDVDVCWVFGGTAVGKKHFINTVCSQSRFIPSCIADGEIDPMEIVSRSSLGSPQLVRWQWGREHTFENISENFPQVQHGIVYVQTSPEIQHSRACHREGEDRWEQEELRRGSKVSCWIAWGIWANSIPFPFTTIDISDDNPDKWRIL